MAFDPTSPRTAGMSHTSKIPRRRPSSSYSVPTSPTKPSHSRPTPDPAIERDASPLLHERRRSSQSRTRTRTRTLSTDLSVVESPVRAPALTIEIPKPSPRREPPNGYATPRSRQASTSYPIRTGGIGAHDPPEPTLPPMAERRRDRIASSNLVTPATYESFDFPLPGTPREERDARLAAECERRRAAWCGLAQWWIRPYDPESSVGETTRLLPRKREQTKWQYVWGEVQCYAKHMLPPILLFVVLVLVVALFAYKHAIRRIIDDRFPPAAEEP
ncbi:uncharacterized protein JCM15063_006365 [Sporobolomyces koalae]|uniref:uncharacterized protein n=1 Tax=Sporobolomyces koalae TaxID=500713 RepID=UPI00317715CF